jgi:hypothetical protein
MTSQSIARSEPFIPELERLIADVMDAWLQRG